MKTKTQDMDNLLQTVMIIINYLFVGAKDIGRYAVVDRDPITIK